MEVVIFCGIQGCGKSSFYVEKFFNTHIHISLDVVKTRYREKELIKKCLELSQPIVIDNTNPTIADREKYFSLIDNSKAKVIGYYFESKIEDCLKRNAARSIEKQVPEIGIRGTRNKFEFPSFNEKFDELYFVKIIDNQFEVQEWASEI